MAPNQESPKIFGVWGLGLNPRAVCGCCARHPPGLLPAWTQVSCSRVKVLDAALSGCFPGCLLQLGLGPDPTAWALQCQIHTSPTDRGSEVIRLGRTPRQQSHAALQELAMHRGCQSALSLSLSLSLSLTYIHILSHTHTLTDTAPNAMQDRSHVWDQARTLLYLCLRVYSNLQNSSCVCTPKQP